VTRYERLRAAERWIAWVRLGAVVFAVLEVAIFSVDYPPGYERWAWVVTAVFGAGSLVLFVVSRRVRPGWILPVGIAALLFDTAVIASYAVVYSYEYGSPTRWALIFAVVEGALRYGLLGGVGVAVALIPFFAFVESWRAHKFGPPGFVGDRVSFPAGIHVLTGLIVGWLVGRLDEEADRARGEAAEAAALRDEVGRRVDVLEAANRAARALGSSLDLDQAFGAFIRELQGLIPFARTAIVLVENDAAHVIAAAGRGADEIFPPGSGRPLRGSLLEEVLKGQPVAREDMSDVLYPEEEELLRLGLRSRLAAPLLVGARAIGMIAVVREQPNAFAAEDVELLSLLGRLAATAVQNIRAYESERQTVDELRRLSALRADFVSLVSHELRSPMAAVIGSARTLQQRWRQLAPEQRDAFLALIGDETERLATLIGDVLDTSRIEAGTFSYAFSDVDMGELLNEAVAAAEMAQDEVPVRAAVSGSLPRIRGDRERLRQVLQNLIDNAVKYSPVGEGVEIAASADNGTLRVDVRDRGPGIPAEQRGLIFEKFGRADVGGSAKPGTGLGLFIARSIAEAHGGAVDLKATAGPGATFRLTLPL